MYAHTEKDVDAYLKAADKSFQEIAYSIEHNDIDEKLVQPGVIHNDLGDFINEIITEKKMNEELYLKLLPNKKLYKVVYIRAKQY